MLVLRRERFHSSAIDLCKLAGMSFMYTAAALLLFYGLNYMPSGVATTIQFLYPVMVMLLMIAFFHEQFSMITACSIVLAVAGGWRCFPSGAAAAGPLPCSAWA